MLPSMGLQRIGHTLATDHHQQCLIFSLGSQINRGGKKKLGRDSIVFLISYAGIFSLAPNYILNADIMLISLGDFLVTQL